MSLLWVFVEDLSSQVHISLSADESRHVAARRLKSGDRVVAFDGAGTTAFARIAVVGRRGVELERDEVAFTPRPVGDWLLATAIPKAERLATLLPMLTQLGVGCWQPLALDDSVVRTLDPEAARFRRILVESAKLARRPWLLDVRPACDLEAVLREGASRPFVCFGDRDGDEAGIPAAASLVVIGPEAGFSEREHRRLVEIGARACSLSPFNLRIETAAIAAAATRWAASRNAALTVADPSPSGGGRPIG